MGVLYFSGRSPVCFLREEVLCVLGRGLQAGPVLSRRSTLSPLASASLHLVPRRSPPSRPRPRPVPRTAWPLSESAFVPRRAVRGVPAAKNSSQQERPGRASLRCPRPHPPRALLVSCRLCPGPGSVPARPSTRALGCRASSRRAAVIRSERVQALTSPPPEAPTGSRRFPLPPVPHGVAPSVPLHGLTAHSLLASSMWAEPGPPLCGDCFARHGRPPGWRGGGLCSDPWLLLSPAACSRPVPSASSAPLLWSDCWTTVGFKSGSLFFPYLHTLLRDHIHFHGFKYRLHNNDF